MSVTETAAALVHACRVAGVDAAIVFQHFDGRDLEAYREALAAPDGIADTDPHVACSALNRGVEQCVALAFTQYQWTYKRWPRSAVAPAVAQPAPTSAAAVRSAPDEG